MDILAFPSSDTGEESILHIQDELVFHLLTVDSDGLILAHWMSTAYSRSVKISLTNFRSIVLCMQQRTSEQW